MAVDLRDNIFILCITHRYTQTHTHAHAPQSSSAYSALQAAPPGLPFFLAYPGRLWPIEVIAGDWKLRGERNQGISSFHTQGFAPQILVMSASL